MTEESDIDIEFEIQNDKISKKEDSSSYSDPTPESDKYSESDSEEEIVSEKTQPGDTVERERSSNLENGLDDKEVGELVEIGNSKVTENPQERSSHALDFSEEQIVNSKVTENPQERSSHVTEFSEEQIGNQNANEKTQERSSHVPEFSEEQIEEMLERRVLVYFRDKTLLKRQVNHLNELVELFRKYPALMNIQNPIEMLGSALQSASLLRHKLSTKFKAQKKSQIKAQNSDSSKNKLGKIPRAKKSIALGRIIGHTGRPYLLNASEEDYVVQRLKILLLIGWAPTLDETIDIANEIIMSWFHIDPKMRRPLIVSKNWVRKFARRNKLKISKSTPIEYKRIIVNEEIVEDFFITLKGLFEEKEYISKLIFNMDETSLQLSKSETYSVISPEIKKKSYRAKLPTKRHMSAVCTISAWGNCLKTLYLLPQKSLNKKVFEKTNLSNYAYAISPRGFITKVLFYEWVRCVFIPGVEAIREFNKLPKDEWALLVLDGHNSRANLAAIHLLQKHYIDCVVIPSHSSHLLQPLDVGIFKYFKDELRRQQRKKKRKKFFLLVDHCFNYATSTMRCVDAFEDAGIYPLKILKINTTKNVRVSHNFIKIYRTHDKSRKKKEGSKKKSSKKHKPPSHLFKQLFLKIDNTFSHKQFNFGDENNIIHITRSSSIEQFNKRLINDENNRKNEEDIRKNHNQKETNESLLNENQEFLNSHSTEINKTQKHINRINEINRRISNGSKKSGSIKNNGELQTPNQNTDRSNRIENSQKRKNRPRELIDMEDSQTKISRNNSNLTDQKGRYSVTKNKLYHINTINLTPVQRIFYPSNRLSTSNRIIEHHQSNDLNQRPNITTEYFQPINPDFNDLVLVQEQRFTKDTNKENSNLSTSRGRGRSNGRGRGRGRGRSRGRGNSNSKGRSNRGESSGSGRRNGNDRSRTNERERSNESNSRDRDRTSDRERTNERERGRKSRESDRGRSNERERSNESSGNNRGKKQ
ncbi:nnp-1 protein putative nuclear protein 1 nop52 [Anaeramoeba flamelloides]|uniref:Nnp-1 protein putative nuclear protein 1 nop52 n=1 Tax=Anaeramoeba flamelloides TaxID=1746091 RepID=A0AAV8A0R8_9EUKA|nr:nnp-1 protein putative nuclear protein 1 nop52 [Anaeramoeba flamelloides]